MSDKPREWFAVKRARKSSYQFYEPNPGNRKTIEAIAPDGGNFEVICLIEKSAYDAMAAENERLRLENSVIRLDLQKFASIPTNTGSRGFDEYARAIQKIAKKGLEK